LVSAAAGAALDAGPLAAVELVCASTRE